MSSILYKGRKNTMRNDEMLIGELLIEVIRKKNLKNLYVRVNPPEGNVTVSTPMELSNEDIKLFVLKKLPEITKVRDRMLSQERQSKREYVSGESHYLWGKPYRLQVVYEGTQHKIVKFPTKIIMTVPTDVAIYLLNNKRAELASMEDEFNTEIVIIGDDSLMNIDQYSIQRVAPEQNKTDELLNAYLPSTDAKRKNAQHIDARRATSNAPRRKRKSAPAKKKTIWQKLVG